MSAFLEYLSSAVKNIRSNKLRTGLTMLGIIIGIASVIAVLTIGDGLTAYVQNEVSGFSANMSMLYMDPAQTSELFTPDDLRALTDELPGITGVTYDFSDVGVLTGRRASVDVAYTAGTEALEDYSANKVYIGRYFTRADVDSHAPVMVIMKRDAEKLFGTDNVVGNTVDMSVSGITKTFTIVGVREDYSKAILTMLDEMTDFMAFAELPYTSLADAYHIDASGFNEIIMFVSNDAEGDVTKKAIRFMKKRHGIREDDVIISQSMSDVSEQIDTIMGAITAFMSFVAAISLLVGGIGVMNIMLVSVTERTREIGIRKSIGARTGSIMIQFLAEASIISLLGGIVGIVFGITAAAVGCHFLELDLIIKPSVVALATVFSTCIGLFFGIHPARKAAKMRPIDALRY